MFFFTDFSFHQKMTESQLKVWQQGIPYTTDQWMSYFALIKPTLSLVHATLCQLIQAFRDEKDVAVESKEEPTESEDKAEPLTINPVSSAQFYYSHHNVLSFIYKSCRFEYLFLGAFIFHPTYL